MGLIPTVKERNLFFTSTERRKAPSIEKFLLMKEKGK